MAFFARYPKKLDSFVSEYIEKYPHRRKLKKGMILAAWPEVVGRAIAIQVKDVRFEGDRFLVKVENAVWRHEIHMQRHSIKSRLNAKVGEEIISDIIVIP